MDAKRSGTFYSVKKILETFVLMGAELRTAEPTVRDDEGDRWSVRYLLNRRTGRFVPIVDLEDDDFVSAGEVTDWERRIGITIPRPPTA